MLQGGLKIMPPPIVVIYYYGGTIIYEPPCNRPSMKKGESYIVQVGAPVAKYNWVNKSERALFHFVWLRGGATSQMFKMFQMGNYTIFYNDAIFKNKTIIASPELKVTW